MDDAHRTTGVLMDRLIRTLLAGIAARTEGITGPFFVDPRRVNHVVPAPCRKVGLLAVYPVVRGNDPPRVP